MAPDPTIADAIARLFQRTAHGIRPGLERVTSLLSAMDHPQHAYLCVHVAGTNGKGSVCAMIESVLRAAGLRTGLYTSPHLVRFHERLRVDGRPVDDTALASLFEAVEAAAAPLEAAPGARPLTFFELTTAMAFEHFRRAGVQVAVVEVGMGGRWDATNVVRPLLSVLCDVDVDHVEYLGEGLEDIAREKCGVIKPGRPVVSGVDNPEVRARVAETARAQGSPLVLAEEAVSVRRVSFDWSGQRLRIETPSRRWPAVRLPLLGEHQVRNAALAVAAIEVFGEQTGVDVPAPACRAGLESVVWPARLQVLSTDPPTMLDCGHNPHAARALARALHELSGARPAGLICGMLADKDAAGFLRLLAGRAARAWAVPLGGERGRTAEDLCAVMRGEGMAAVAATLPEAWEAARAWARDENGLVCIGGSLYLAGDVLKRYAGGNRLFEEDKAE